MKGVIVEQLGGHKFQSPAEIARVCFDEGELVVTLVSEEDGKSAAVKFLEIAGFRQLDEGDLLEYWPACAGANGWLYRIHENGWLDLESLRPGFMRKDCKGLFEYFIASQNSCISVLAWENPEVEFHSI